MTLRPDRTYSREWSAVTEEEREAANESIRLALLDTPTDHPDFEKLNPEKA
jgi:hypothetical protein